MISVVVLAASASKVVVVVAGGARLHRVRNDGWGEGTDQTDVFLSQFKVAVLVLTLAQVASPRPPQLVSKAETKLKY